MLYDPNQSTGRFGIIIFLELPKACTKVGATLPPLLYALSELCTPRLWARKVSFSTLTIFLRCVLRLRGYRETSHKAIERATKSIILIQRSRTRILFMSGQAFFGNRAKLTLMARLGGRGIREILLVARLMIRVRLRWISIILLIRGQRFA